MEYWPSKNLLYTALCSVYLMHFTYLLYPHYDTQIQCTAAVLLSPTLQPTHNVDDVKVFLVRPLCHQHFLTDVVHLAELLWLKAATINQSINKSINQSESESNRIQSNRNRSIHQSINQSESESKINPSINQSINQSNTMQLTKSNRC